MSYDQLPDASPSPSGAPLVTVVIPAYGAEEFIEYTMRSVAQQTHRPMELIVVDDCSPDRTGQIAERIASKIAEPDFVVRVEHHDLNRGGAGALLTGFTLARGDFICWLSADDAYASPEKTSTQLAIMLSSGAGLSYDSASQIGPTPETAERVTHRWSNGRFRVSDDRYLRYPTWRLLALNFGNPINGSSVMIRCDVVRELGTFDPVLRNIDQDSDLWQRYSALGVTFARTTQTGVFYRIHEGQTSNLTEAVEWGCAITRVRILQALLATGELKRVLNRAWPVLLLARPGQFAFFSLVSQALCTLGPKSGCGGIPRLILAGLRRELVRRGHWNEAQLGRLLEEAAESSMSEEFQRFVERLRSREGLT